VADPCLTLLIVLFNGYQNCHQAPTLPFTQDHLNLSQQMFIMTTNKVVQQQTTPQLEGWLPHHRQVLMMEHARGLFLLYSPTQEAGSPNSIL